MYFSNIYDRESKIFNLIIDIGILYIQAFYHLQPSLTFLYSLYLKSNKIQYHLIYLTNSC